MKQEITSTLPGLSEHVHFFKQRATLVLARA
jgi:hypothetical protein